MSETVEIVDDYDVEATFKRGFLKAITNSSFPISLQLILATVNIRFVNRASSIDAVAFTNGLDIYVNKDYKRIKFDMSESTFILLHEAMHILSEHVFRNKNKVHKIWNYATDYYINSLLKDLPSNVAKLPEKVLYDEKLSYKTFATPEDIYAYLMDEENGYVKYVGPDYDGPVDGYLPNNAYEDIQKDILPDTELNKAKVRALKDLIAQDIKNRTHGKNLSDIDRIIMEKFLSGAHVDYRRHLGSFIHTVINTKAFKNTYARVNHRLGVASKNFIFPKTYLDKKPSIYVCVDTSGSITDKILKIILNECATVMTHADIYMLSWDTQVHNLKQVKTLTDLVNYQFKGYGGTDPECIFEYFKENNINPSGMIVYTDGYFCKLKGNPRIPTIWIAVDGTLENITYGRKLEISVD